jgi:aspartate/methionine/tyrosine aminotransferase
MTGWRVGWMAGPNDVIKAAINFQSHLCGNVSNVAQRAALAAVAGPLDAVAQMRAAFDKRRRTIVDLLSAIPGVECPTPEGAFYAYPSVKGLLGKEIRGTVSNTSVELAALLLEQAEVAAVPGEAFGTDGYFRMAYALAEDDMITGVNRMADLFREAK